MRILVYRFSKYGKGCYSSSSRISTFRTFALSDQCKECKKYTYDKLFDVIICDNDKCHRWDDELFDVIICTNKDCNIKLLYLGLGLCEY